MTPIFLTSAQVAQRLGLTDGDAFLRQRARLERDTLFPPPMPTQRRPLRWKADEVQAWVDRHGLSLPPDTPPAAAAFGQPRLRDLARTA